MIIAFTIIVILLLIPIIGKINLSNRFDKEVKEFFAQSESKSDKIYHSSQLNDLPEPVQRYFNHVLKDGQPYISYVRARHGGKFKAGLDKSWVNITGEQYATTERPGFIWKGTTSMFTARDMYISDKGRLVATLFSLINVVDAKGKKYDHGELLRWLGESILYPTNFLPGERLQWLPVDSQTAKLIYHYKEISLFFKVKINEIGEITEMESERYMDGNIIYLYLLTSKFYGD